MRVSQAGTVGGPVFREAEAGWPSRASEKERRAATRIVKAALVCGAALSIGPFTESLIPPEVSALQQVASTLMWATIIAASSVLPRRAALSTWTDLGLALTFFAFAIVSSLWSPEILASLAKASVLFVTTFAAYRLAFSLTVDEIVDCLVFGLTLTCAGSVFLALFVPEIGIVQTGMHEGQWSGLHASKQSLGAVGALLIFFGGYRLLTQRRLSLYVLGALALASACVIGSGSRGGGSVAVVAIVLLYLVRRAPRIGILLAFGPFVMTVIALVLIGHLYATGDAYFLFFDERIDLTERTLLWHHALERFEDRAIFGYGLNGFWSVETVLHAFAREHGWVLDNHHSGYVAILMETGLVGTSLYLSWFLMFGLRIATPSGREHVPAAHLHLVIAYLNLVFFYNFTETFFLRSTNLMAVMLATLFFVSCQGRRRTVLNALNPSDAER